MKPLAMLPLKIFHFAFAGIVFCSCSKKEDPSDKNRQILLGSWKLVAETSDKAYDWDGNGTLESDRFLLLDPCEQDRVITFSDPAIGLYQFDCNEEQAFTWELKQNGNYIGYHFPKINDTLPYGLASAWIEEISDTLLKLRTNSVAPGNGSVRPQVFIVSGFVKQ